MGAMGYLFAMLILFLIAVGLSRWIFRINDIVNRLDSIMNLLKAGLDVEEVRVKAGPHWKITGKKTVNEEQVEKPYNPEIMPEKPEDLSSKRTFSNKCPECNYIFASPCPAEGWWCPKCKARRYPKKV